MEDAVEKTSILVRRSEAFVVISLLLAGVVFGQDAPMVSPPLTMKPGTTLAVRINEPLSSDHSPASPVGGLVRQPAQNAWLQIMRFRNA